MYLLQLLSTCSYQPTRFWHRVQWHYSRIILIGIWEVKFVSVCQAVPREAGPREAGLTDPWGLLCGDVGYPVGQFCHTLKNSQLNPHRAQNWPLTPPASYPAVHNINIIFASLTNQQETVELKYIHVENAHGNKGWSDFPIQKMWLWLMRRLECKQRMYVDALMMCPQKFLAVKSTPMVINAIMQNHPRIKSIRQIQAR